MSRLQARNEAVIDAPIDRIWAVITDIQLLPRIAPGVISAAGSMNELHATRTCTVDNKGRKGTITEKLVEYVPERKTVWALQSDTMGMSRMLRDTRFCFTLERISDTQTKVTNETWYEPSSLIARIMNGLMMKRMMAGAQARILQNIRTLTENQ